MSERARQRLQHHCRGHGAHAARITARPASHREGAPHSPQQGGQSKSAKEAQVRGRAVHEIVAQAASGGGHATQGGEETRRKREDHERGGPREAEETRRERDQAREEKESVQDEAGQDKVHVEHLRALLVFVLA